MPNEVPNYLQTIEDEFSRIRGKYSQLSPMDWQLAETWENNGYPLHVVLSAMSEVFRQFEATKRGGKINGLSYFKQEVEKQFASWSERQVGKATIGIDVAKDGEEFTVINEIDESSVANEVFDRLEFIKFTFIDNTPFCPASLQPTLDQIITVIDSLFGEENLEQIELVLQKEQILLDKTVLEVLPNEEFNAFFQQTKSLVKNSGYESFAAQLAMQNKLICKEFYKKHNLPKLTLYEL